MPSGTTLIIHPGDVFSWLTIVREVEKEGKRRRFECQCKCGRTTVSYLHCLRSGVVKACGCRRYRFQPTHGMTGTPEQKAWRHMIERCTVPNDREYRYYGARGVTVCPEWRHDFAVFYAYIGPRPSPEHSVDRYPDQNGNYEPGNVRWATRTEQARNKRNNIWIDYKEERRLLIEVCTELGLTREQYRTITKRRRSGWPVEHLFDPVNSHYHPHH